MTAEQWVSGRTGAWLTQVEAAQRLGISQPYLSQLERGVRRAPDKLAEKAAALFGRPTALPRRTPEEYPERWDPERLQGALAALGYPKFGHVWGGALENPAAVVLGALVQQDLDTRLVEALPWVLGRYVDLDWGWLRDECKLRDVQNRLGYVVHLAKGVLAREGGASTAVEVLTGWEQELERARLAREETLCRESMPQAERKWLRAHRPEPAVHWNVLTNLRAEELAYLWRDDLAEFEYLRR